MATVAPLKLKLYPPNAGRGASPFMRRRRRQFYANNAFRAFAKGDVAGAKANIAFAINNNVRVGDLARAAQSVLTDEAKLDQWLALLRESPLYSARALMKKRSQLFSARFGTPPLTDTQVDDLVGDFEPDRVAAEAAFDQALAAGYTPPALPSYTSVPVTTTQQDWGDTTELIPTSSSPGVSKWAQKLIDQGFRYPPHWREPALSVKAKFAYEYAPDDEYFTRDYRRAYYMGMDWESVTKGQTGHITKTQYDAGKRGACLISSKSQRDKLGRPYPPSNAPFGSAKFDLWVSTLCNATTQRKALELEAAYLAASSLVEAEAATEWAASGKMSIGEQAAKTREQQEANLSAVMQGNPLVYPSPPFNRAGESNLYVLPPNAQVAGLPVNPASWKGDWASKPPPPLPGAVAGQEYKPPPATIPQQVVDPATGQVSTVQVPSGSPTQQYPGGPLPPAYPTAPGQTYPGYTPPPPPPPEESLEPKKKKKKKSSMTLPLVLGVGALGVGALVVIRSRR